MAYHVADTSIEVGHRNEPEVRPAGGHPVVHETPVRPTPCSFLTEGPWQPFFRVPVASCCVHWEALTKSFGREQRWWCWAPQWVTPAPLFAHTTVDLWYAVARQAAAPARVPRPVVSLSFSWFHKHHCRVIWGELRGICVVSPRGRRCMAAARHLLVRLAGAADPPRCAATVLTVPKSTNFVALPARGCGTCLVGGHFSSCIAKRPREQTTRPNLWV